MSLVEQVQQILRAVSPVWISILLELIQSIQNWFTTREAVLSYLKTERRPGPKPKKRTTR